MSIEVHYAKHDSQLIQCDFSGGWNDQDFDRALTLTRQMIANAGVTKRCIVLFNMENMSTPSVSVLDLMGNLLEAHAASIETYVVISRDPLLSSMLQLNSAFYEYFGVQLILADSLAEAQTLIGQRRLARSY